VARAAKVSPAESHVDLIDVSPFGSSRQPNVPTTCDQQKE
jgi:hypothetical protein